ncbi:sensor histidine kinase [Brumimicrobium aurantiacum]|uniref:Signal transduction histidine kinase internal region domain-containing protein n=1 Tax=Brumimicrobium aurantiacum TaxID=1737063 RepID=A0A3E1EUM9_9FLAO|nr:histidine kinase [Brumimicrobium aurantiacum]RFC53276.1 hypothetical protein DXU93_13820 [Brumimicrobium aurantiacum]
MFKHYIIAFITFLLCFPLFSQENEPMTIPIDYENFGTVYDIVEYKAKNEILIASEKGLFRYTGKVLSPLHSETEETFHKIYLQKEKVYALSFNNSIYRLKNDSLLFIQHFEENIKDLIVIKDSIFVTTPKSLFVGQTADFMKIDFGIDHYHHGFIKTKKGNFLIRQSKNTIDLYNLQKQCKTPTQFKKSVRKVFTSKENNYLVSENIVYEFDQNSSQINMRFDLPIRLLNVKLYDIKIQENGLISIGHNDGLSIWMPNQKKWNHYFRGTPIHAVSSDQFENIWLGTKYEGVLQIPSINILKNDISSILQRKEKIVASYLTNGNLFLGTNLGSLISWNIEQDIKKVIHLAKNGEVQSIAHKDDLLYVYCDQLFVIDLNTYTVIETEKVHSTKDIYVDSDVFVATSEDFQNLTQGIKIDKGKWHNSIYYNPKDELFYLGTKTGLKIVNRNDFSVVSTVEKKRNITEVLELNSDLFMFDFNGEAVGYHSGKTTKLPIANIRKVVKINDNEVLCYNKSEVVLFNAAFNKGRKINFISAITKGKNIVSISTSNNNLYITTLSDVYIIQNYAQFLYKTPPHDISLIVSKKNGEIITKTINLSHKNNGLELYLKSNKDLSFFTYYDLYYTIGDQEGEWTKIEPNQQNAFQFNLAFVPEGNSVLQFILETNDNTLKHSVNTYVNAPFYKSFWFILIIFISITFLLIVIQKRRLNLMKKENLKRIQEERLKTRLFKSELTAIRSQMNPHFVFNTLSSIQLKIAKKETGAAFKMVQKFSSLMRGILNYSQTELISLKQELDILNNYLELERNRFEDELIIEMNINEEMDLEDFRIPSLITQPIAENSIHHGLKHKHGEKKISIILHKIDDLSYSLEIIDNGIGIEKANQINAENKKPDSFAMKAIKKRISYINSLNEISVDLEIASNEEGTKTTIKVKEYD